MFRQRQELVHDKADHLGAVLGFPLLDDMLCHVVSVLVSDEHLGAAVQLLHHCFLVGFGPVLESPLDNSATVLVGSELANTVFEAVHDEIDVLPGNQGDDLLDDVVSVLLLDDLQDIRLQLLDQFGLLLDKDVLQGLPLVSF